MIKRKIICVVCFFILIGIVAFENASAQTPYYTKLDSVGAAAVTGTTDSLASFRPGRTCNWVGVTITNSTVQDTLKCRGTWYGNSTSKTISLRNTRSGTVDSVFIITLTNGFAHTYELVDPNVDYIEFYSSNGGYSATRKSKVYFRYRYR